MKLLLCDAPETRKWYVCRQFEVRVRLELTDLKTMYRDPDGLTKPVDDLDRISSSLPIHLIQAGLSDYMLV